MHRDASRLATGRSGIRNPFKAKWFGFPRAEADTHSPQRVEADTHFPRRPHADEAAVNFRMMDFHTPTFRRRLGLRSPGAGAT
jgi:hypothetical protein